MQGRQGRTGRAGQDMHGRQGRAGQGRAGQGRAGQGRRCILLSKAGALVVGDGVASLEALQVLSQAIVFSLQLHQLCLPAYPAALQLAPLLALALNLSCQVVYHRFKRACHGQMLCLTAVTDATVLSLTTHGRVLL